MCVYLGLARTGVYLYLYGIFGREITKYTVIYDVYIRFWPTLLAFALLLMDLYLCLCVCLCVCVCVCMSVRGGG